jgi:chaperone LolA
MRYLLTALCLSIASSFVHADAIFDLKMFIKQSRSLSADFVQTVIDQNGKKSPPASGNMRIQRPGKFHWRYAQPYPSEIIGDGKKVWLYDPELKQVTIKEMTKTIDSSPAALLAGSNDFEKNYHTKNLPIEADIHWIKAIPKSTSSTFQYVKIGLKNKHIHALILVDQLGQTTSILFKNLKLNPKIPSSEFVFVPPKDADIISD